MNNAANINAVLEALKANSKKRGSRKTRSNIEYTLSVPEDLSTIQLPPQAINLVGILLESGEDTWREPELIELIEENSEVLKTKQEPWKIFQYYRNKLKDAGFISFEKVED